MNKLNSNIRLFLFPLILLMVFTSCYEEVELNITPMAVLVFDIKDIEGNPVPEATVYLFPQQSSYSEYRNSNLDGLENRAPDTALDNIATSDLSGRVTFPPRDLQGTGYTSGDSWRYKPDPIYVRVEAVQQGGFLNNDADTASVKIEFEELGSGEFITVTTEVILQ